MEDIKEYTAKKETSSPKVSREAMMISCVIDMKEGLNMWL